MCCAVLDAAGSEQPVLVSIAEGCALAVLFAASHPERGAGAGADHADAARGPGAGL